MPSRRPTREIALPQSEPGVLYGLGESRFGSPLVEVRVVGETCRADVFRVVSEIVDASEFTDPEIRPFDFVRGSLPSYVATFTFDHGFQAERLLARLATVAGARRVSCEVPS